MTVYRSKISSFIILSAAVPILAVGAFYISYQSWGPLGFLSLIITFVIYLYRTTYYAIKGNTLNVHSGFMINTDINIGKIKTITETSTILSAPAWSTDRIEIFYNIFDSIVISPPDKARFVADLQAINPAITMKWKDKK
jgi:hypothetical protein